MRFLYLFSCCCLISLSVISQSAPARDAHQDSAGGIRLRCVTSISNDSNPLILVDGVPVPTGDLSAIDIATIETIEILKNAESLALHGPKAVNGVIVVTTKKPGSGKLIIRDFSTGENLPGATVLFSNEQDSAMAIANESGVVVRDKLAPGRAFEVKVTMAGYEAFDSTFTRLFAEHTILLKRAVKNCPEVIVLSYPAMSRCHEIVCMCGVSDCRIVSVDSASSTYLTGKQDVLIYPNPARKGQTVTVRLKSQPEHPIQVKIFSLDGRLLLSRFQPAVKSQEEIIFQTDSRWSAGAYIVQLLDAAGKRLQAGRLLIQ